MFGVAFHFSKNQITFALNAALVDLLGAFDHEILSIVPPAENRGGLAIPIEEIRLSAERPLVAGAGYYVVYIHERDIVSVPILVESVNGNLAVFRFADELPGHEPKRYAYDARAIRGFTQADAFAALVWEHRELPLFKREEIQGAFWNLESKTTCQKDLEKLL